MIYLIGGPVRVGKSRLAGMMLERCGVASITTDALTNSIGRTLTETHLAGSDIPQEEWEMNFYPFLRRFIKTIQFDYDNFLLEGAVISPNVARKLLAKFEIRCVFVGDSLSTTEKLIRYMGNNVWLRSVDSGTLAKIPERIIARSQELRVKCETLDFKYVDLAGDYQGQLEKAFQYLTVESKD